MRRWSCFRCTWSIGLSWTTGRPFLIAAPTARLGVLAVLIAVRGQRNPLPLMLSQEVMSELDGRREIRNAHCAGATSSHSTSIPTNTGLAGARPDQAVVEPEEQKRGWPLPDEDGPIVLARELEHRRDADRAQRRPVPRFLGHIVRNAKKGLLRFHCLVLRLCHVRSPFPLLLATPAPPSRSVDETP